MSVSDRALLAPLARTAVDHADRLGFWVGTLFERVTDGVRAVAFWVATLLPLSYPALLASGVTAEHPLGFVALLCANAAAFVLGHGYDPRRRDRAGQTTHDRREATQDR